MWRGEKSKNLKLEMDGNDFLVFNVKGNEIANELVFEIMTWVTWKDVLALRLVSSRMKDLVTHVPQPNRN